MTEMHLIIAMLSATLGGLIAWALAEMKHRRDWLNALQDDISLFMRALNVVHDAHFEVTQGTAQTVKDLKEARTVCMFAYYRLKLRLDPAIPIQRQLQSLIDSTMTVTTAVPDEKKIAEIVDVARRALKRAWFAS